MSENYGRKQASSARTQAAANGLDLSADNTVVDVIDNDINSNAYKDAWTSFFNAKNQSTQYKNDASNFNSQAHNATVSGVLNTTSTALNAYGNTPSNAFSNKTSTQSVNSIQSNALTMDTSRLKQNSSGWA
ncbi:MULTISPECIES: hypothetical protein [Acinetobacter]|uniref:hypothetical protein n=1 Tax=Acinetobacter TaxID=469 RepID=UPI0002AEDA14|nr:MULTISPECIES: hypothetical protein [Acinetobacter]ELW77061.1 hypothetical protein ACINWC743_A0644 [Acinetobacter sp. WC-743]MBJ8428117.1 hypothetical protein [Acinetobacter bereziniae]